MQDDWNASKLSDDFSPPEDSHQHELSQEDISQKKKKKKKNNTAVFVIGIIIAAVVIVLAALFLTVVFVDDFNSVGELINYIKAQY